MKQRWRKEVEKRNKNEGRGMVTKKRSRERKEGKIMGKEEEKRNYKGGGGRVRKEVEGKKRK